MMRGLRLDQLLHVLPHLVDDLLLLGDRGHGFDGRGVFLSCVTPEAILRILLLLRLRLLLLLVTERVSLRRLLV
jgi:hypothetical protein